jgi:predicted ABC-type ATPase
MVGARSGDLSIGNLGWRRLPGGPQKRVPGQPEMKGEDWFGSVAFDVRPVVLALAGANGAGKTTFYNAFLKPSGLRFLNADFFARELGIDAYEAARIVATLRDELVKQRESFVFETVFSDPVGDKLAFLRQAAEFGYTVVLCFIGIASPRISEERVAMRVSQGGHDVPSEKLISRFPRTLSNLRAAVRELPWVFVFDNNDLRTPFRQVAVFQNGRTLLMKNPVPDWLKPLL